MGENYDVIIIGSGAGGGTLAHALAGSGKRILLLERGDFLPRERTTGTRNQYTWTGSTSPRTPVRPRRQAVPAPGSLLRRRGDQAVQCRLVPAAPPGTGEIKRQRDLPGLAVRMTTSSRGTSRPSSCTRCTATAGRTRPKATGASRPQPPVSHEAGSSRSSMTWPRAATTRSTRRAGSC
jgi:choline dehydrogenase-like flavoprotein